MKHDDRLDALSIAVAYWVEAMARDEDKAMQDYHAGELDRELKRFMETQVRRGSSGKRVSIPDTWVVVAGFDQFH